MSLKRGLGKGLSDMGLTELLGDIKKPIQPDATTATEAADTSQGEFRQLDVKHISPGRYQPRRNIDEADLTELADSIRAQGVVQPLLVRRTGDNEYELIAGERRWRASQLAGLTTVPAVIRTLPDEAAMAIGLIENIQRQDLNAVEEAMALQRLIQEFDMTHEAVARAVGKSRTNITNMLRLLNLTAGVKRYLESGELDMGHARALLALDPHQQIDIAQTIIERGLSVRQTEALIRSLHTQHDGKNSANINTIDPNVANLQRNLSEKLGAVVNIRHQPNGKGKVVLHYNSLDELDGILNHIK